MISISTVQYLDFLLEGIENSTHKFHCINLQNLPKSIHSNWEWPHKMVGKTFTRKIQRCLAGDLKELDVGRHFFEKKRNILPQTLEST